MDWAALTHPNGPAEDVRGALTALARLVRSGDTTPEVTAELPAYLRLLAAHPDDGVRLGAAHLIGTLGPAVAGGAGAALRQASVGDRADLVRAAAVLALGERGETADDRLADPAPLVRLTAALVLAESDVEAALPGPVVQILERDAPDALQWIARLPGDGTCGQLRWVLGRLRSREDLRVRLLTGWLHHPEPEVREAAALAGGAALKRING